ncbi:THAP domain-containing protein 9, partial [Trachymyrmex cornetzi]
KKFALSLYFLSPKNYKELKKTIALPSVRSLQLFTQTWNTVPGINEKLFEALKVKLSTLPLIERHCVLCADETSLKSFLFYDILRDEIIGFEDFGDRKTSVPAKSALVIMARSIAGNWKLPVCFCFIETACPATFLKNIIFDIIIKLKNNGALVHAFISDMGSNFIQLSHMLNISVDNSSFVVDGERLVYIFDTPHLLKATRNNLLKYNFQIDNKIASWDHIVEFYKRDSKQWIKAAPALTKSHIEPNNFLRMKVKYAAQIFSNHVAAGMCTQMSSGFLPTEAVGTIDFIDHFDKLFDILNSSNVNNPKEYGKVFVGSDKQMQFLENMLNFFNSIKVINDKNKYVKLKCLDCWQITIKSTIQLWTTLKNFNFPYLRSRRLNQDSLENFFGSVRKQGGNCLNPTPIQFKRAFKKLFSMKLLEHSETRNCANDNDDLLNIIGTSNTTERPQFQNLCLAIHSCAACQNFINDNKAVLDNTTLYCSFRAYENENGDLFGNLNIPTNDFCYYIHKLEEIFVKNFEKNCYKQNIGNYLFQLAQNIAFEPPCPDFPKNFLIKLFLRMHIYYTLSQHNKSCKTITRKNRKLLNILHL